MTQIETIIKQAPLDPGVYQFYDQKDKVIYVGKAKSLRKRLQQYLGQDSRPQIPFLMAQAVRVETIVTKNELEALFLERTLINRLTPKYNILLKDDKSYAFIKLDHSTQIPQFVITRQKNRQVKDKFFGPYSAVYKIKELLETARKIFMFCSAQKVSQTPCFHYHLKKCPGVCFGKISLEEYEHTLQSICLFLNGKYKQIERDLHVQMSASSRAQQYEKAASIRDRLKALSLLEEKQHVILSTNLSADIISGFVQSNLSCINLFQVRNGRVVNKENFVYTCELHDTALSDTLTRFTEEYYPDTENYPSKIYFQTPPEDTTFVQEFFVKADHKVLLSSRSTGAISQIIRLGALNAEKYLLKYISENLHTKEALHRTLSEMQGALSLPYFPRRIECYDISNTQGTNPVGSQVVFTDGFPDKGEYRKYKIRVKNTPDDFAMMREMLTRRCIQITKAAAENTKKKTTTPDLIVVDGGKGQLGVVYEVLTTHNLSIPVVGLAKRIEEVFFPEQSTPLILPHSTPILQLLQRLRDEAHRFAITFHRDLRSKQMVKSELDEIPGIGPKTKKLLKSRFGTLKAIRAASDDELRAAIGIAKTTLLKKYL